MIMATRARIQLTFQGKRTLDVGPWTTLIVLVKSSGKLHEKRRRFIQKKMNLLKSSLKTRNATIDRIVIQPFQGEDELKSKAKELIGKETM
ncbi:MAG: hypothetical protein P8074_07110 [Anaerolineales bacterium]